MSQLEVHRPSQPHRYLYLRRGEPAFVVHAYDLEGDYDDDEDSGVVYRCASTFEEFAYRFWVENRIWRYLHGPDAESLPSRLAEYLAHYRSQRPDDPDR